GLRIVSSEGKGRVEHVMKPLLHLLHPAEIETPIVLIEPASGEPKRECQRIAVDQVAVGMPRRPLPETARQAFVMVIGLGASIDFSTRRRFSRLIRRKYLRNRLLGHIEHIARSSGKHSCKNSLFSA